MVTAATLDWKQKTRGSQEQDKQVIKMKGCLFYSMIAKMHVTMTNPVERGQRQVPVLLLAVLETRDVSNEIFTQHITYLKLPY